MNKGLKTSVVSRFTSSSSSRLCTAPLHSYTPLLSTRCTASPYYMEKRGLKLWPQRSETEPEHDNKNSNDNDNNPDQDSAERPILMIPGPIEFSEGVLSAMARPTMSHVSPEFIEFFGSTLEKLRSVVLSESAQPFVVAGSGTMGWDMAIANLLEKGDRALVINVGYFGDKIGECLEAYGAQVTHLNTDIGDCPQIEDVEKLISTEKKKGNTFRMVTLTHVDTSTGVFTNINAYASLIRSLSPDTLILVDGVCATGGEETRMDEWDVDIVLTASQKAIGVPPGLSILFASQRALAAFEKRQTPVQNYFCSWKKWLPIMKAYEARTPMYFATPPVNLICALNASVNEILSEGDNPKAAMEYRFRAHRKAGCAIRNAVKALGLSVIPVRAELEANTITAIRFPTGITGPQLLPKIKENGVELAGGLHPAIKGEYFRIGHMGISATDIGRGYLEQTIAALEMALTDCGYKDFKKNAGVQSLHETLGLKQ